MTAIAVSEAPESTGETQPLQLWDPCTGRFDAPSLRAAIVMRGWTPDEFARAAGVGRTTIYKVLGGEGVRGRTAIAIFNGLALRRPRILLT
jgi:transcriptional regulator of acetoin/glycerol metabolism